LALVNPIGQHINLYTHCWWDEGSLIDRLKSYGFYVILVSFVAGLLTIPLLWGQNQLELISAFLAVFLFVMLGTWNSTLVPMLNMLDFRAESVVWNIISSIVSLVFSISLCIWIQSGTAWLLGQSAGFLIGMFGASRILIRHSVRMKNPHNLKLTLLDRKILLTYCLPLSLATGLMWLQLSGYRLVVEKFWGLTQLGYMVVGFQLAGQVCSLVETLASQYIYPIFFRRCSGQNLSEESSLAFSDLLNTLVPLYLLLAGMIVLSAPYLLNLLVSEEFRGGRLFVMMGAWIELCRVMGNLFSNAAHLRRKTISLAIPYGIGGIISVLMIYTAGLRGMDIEWAGYGLIVGSTAMLITMLISMAKQIRINIDWFRLILGFTGMVVMLLSRNWLPDTSEILSSIIMISLIGALGLSGGVLILWRNPAVLRFAGVEIRKASP